MRSSASRRRARATCPRWRPCVAEALIATAAALSVAIPATFGYNIFASRLNRFDGRMESFSTSVIALLVREGKI